MDYPEPSPQDLELRRRHEAMLDRVMPLRRLFDVVAFVAFFSPFVALFVWMWKGLR